MDISSFLQNTFPKLAPDQRAALQEKSVLKTFSAGAELIRPGQYLHYTPFVIKGLVKVFSYTQEKELLLYYIESNESCIMSFMSCLKQQPSRIHAICEEETTLLLIPDTQLLDMLRRQSSVVDIFFQLFNERYLDLLETISQLTFESLDSRLFRYLLKLSELKQSKEFSIRHPQVALELGTSREVITRVLKKLEQDGKIRQSHGQIKILSA